MDWTEIIITVSLSDVDTVAAIANMAVKGGIYIEDYSDLEKGAEEIAHIDLIDEELVNKDRNKCLVHLYVSGEENVNEHLMFLKERLSAENIEFRIDTTSVKESDWAENWKKYFKSVNIGNRLTICPAWEKPETENGRVILKMDPGAAFGTGTHATTSLCLELLDKYVKGGENVLDIGCGSGILSIAATLLGARNAIGVDIDATSVKVAKENAEMNGVENKTEYIIGDLADKIKGKFNIICANIVADIIIKLSAEISQFMDDSAVFITSGIIDVRVNDVLEGFKSNNLVIIDEYKKDNWYAFALKRGESK